MTKQNVENAQVIQVVAIKLVIGDGTNNNPTRSITEYWSFDGELIAISDPLAPSRQPPP